MHSNSSPNYTKNEGKMPNSSSPVMIKSIVYCMQQCLESVLLCDTCHNGEPVPFLWPPIRMAGHYVLLMQFIITARSERQWTAEGSVFGAVCDFYLFVYEISREPLNEFAPNSQGRHAWSLARTSLMLRSKIKGQGHQGQKTVFSALLAACVRFMFDKTPLALVFCLCMKYVG